ncbi:MAG: hypothetical protein O9289_05230 [Rhodobacteraceae bacterium]|jgi:hypothetical protein|nr:hypothetical protein [Paracoccaceae bacterium]
MAGRFTGEKGRRECNPKVIRADGLQFSDFRRPAADGQAAGAYLVGRGKTTATGSTENRIIRQWPNNRWLSSCAIDQPEREIHRMPRLGFARISAKLTQGKIGSVPNLATNSPKTFELSAIAGGNRGKTMTQRRQNPNFRLDQGRN